MGYLKKTIRNKKSTFNYETIEKYTAGIILTGCEVKSIRDSSVNISDTFCYIKDNALWVKNMRISRYNRSHPSTKHEENRDKKLLLKKLDRDPKYPTHRGKLIKSRSPKASKKLCSKKGAPGWTTRPS